MVCRGLTPRRHPISRLNSALRLAPSLWSATADSAFFPSAIGFVHFLTSRALTKNRGVGCGWRYRSDQSEGDWFRRTRLIRPPAFQPDGRTSSGTTSTLEVPEPPKEKRARLAMLLVPARRRRTSASPCRLRYAATTGILGRRQAAEAKPRMATPASITSPARSQRVCRSP
jgi:hypothetical protein